MTLSQASQFASLKVPAWRLVAVRIHNVFEIQIALNMERRISPIYYIDQWWFLIRISNVHFHFHVWLPDSKYQVLILNWRDIFLGGIVFSPPVRWGLLDFMWAVLLLLLLLLSSHLVHLLASCMSQGADRSGQLRTSTRRVRLQWAAPDLKPALQIAVGSAGPQLGAWDCSGQRRTSPRGLPSGVGSAGPHPGISRAEWAAPDLTSQKICQKICQNICQKYVRQECQKICQKQCQKICQKKCQILVIWQKRMSERMSEDMSEDVSEEMSEDMSIEMSDKNVRRDVKRYVKRYVRNMSDKNAGRNVTRFFNRNVT